jgi:hypothetical protein
VAYPNPKIYHMAHKINQDGGVSALCFKKLKPINLAVASWTYRRTAVTCPKCQRILAGMAYEQHPSPIDPLGGRSANLWRGRHVLFWLAQQQP